MGAKAQRMSQLGSLTDRGDWRPAMLTTGGLTTGGLTTGGSRLGRGDGGLTRSALPGVAQDEVLLDVHVADRDVGGLEDGVIQAGDDPVLAGGQRELVAAGAPGLGREHLPGLEIDCVDLNAALALARLIEIGAAGVVIGNTHQLGLGIGPAGEVLSDDHRAEVGIAGIGLDDADSRRRDTHFEPRRRAAGY